MFYICVKFHEIISNGISYRVDTISIGKITKGNNSAINADGATVLNLCTWSVMLYISTKFCIFTSLSRMVSRLKSGHDFYTENYNGE